MEVHHQSSLKLVFNDDTKWYFNSWKEHNCNGGVNRQQKVDR